MKNTYIIQRILYTLFIFALVVTLCFFIPRIGVEDPCARYYPAQGNMSDENYEMIKELTRQQYGLDGSNWSQYVRYVKNLLKGDLGTSYQAGSPKVWSLIAQRLPWTLVLSVSSMLISLFSESLSGAAWCRKTRRHGRQDADECFHGNNGGSVLFYRTAVVLFSGISVRVASGIYRPEYGIGICMEFKKRGNGCLQCRPGRCYRQWWRYCIICAEYQKQCDCRCQ